MARDIMRQIYEVPADDRRGRRALRPRPVTFEASRPREGRTSRTRSRWAARVNALTRLRATAEVRGRTYVTDDAGVRALREGHARERAPEVRRGPNAAPEPPYDVTAWSLGMLLGVETVFVNNPLPAFKMTKVDGATKVAGEVSGSGSRFAFDYKGPDTAIAINRLLKEGARVAFDGPSHVSVAGVSRGKVEHVAKEFGLRSGVSRTANDEGERRTANAKSNDERRGASAVRSVPRAARGHVATVDGRQQTTDDKVGARQYCSTPVDHTPNPGGQLRLKLTRSSSRIRTRATSRRVRRAASALISCGSAKRGSNT